MMSETEARVINLIHEGFFSVDVQGRIWRHKRFYRGAKLGDVNPKQRAEHVSGHGYLNINLHYGGKQHKAMAHRIVWIYFNGVIPKGIEVNHINGIKNDNRLSNLELVTRSENMKHASSKGWVKLGKGEGHPKAKLTIQKVERIRKIYASGLLTLTELSRMFNVYPSTIERVVTRKHWR